MTPFILGTRGSELALAQTRITSLLLDPVLAGRPLETQIIKTTGDKNLAASLTELGALDKGLFTKELEEALFAQKIHVAIHSMKDLPVEMPPGLVIGAILQRADPSDVLISKHPGGISGLPQGATVATSSPRRRFQLLQLRPDVNVVEIRGNVPTRIRKVLADDKTDALMLAKAGLDRLGSDVVPASLYVSVEEEILPAPAQGAIAIQCRAEDAETLAILARIHHEDTARCVQAERQLLAALGGGCHLPLGTLARIVNGRVVLRSVMFDPFPAHS